MEPAPERNTTAELREAVGREITALKTPPPKQIAAVPTVGIAAPDSPELRLPRPKPALLLFLRHCGDPFAEKNFRRFAALSAKQPGLACIAVSHSSREFTDRWVSEIGGAWNVDVIVDEERDVYARWGLGLNNSWNLFNPVAMYSTYTLGRYEGIWSQPIESGNRWQKGGAFAIDQLGIVRWVHVPNNSDDIVDYDEVLTLLGFPVKKRKPNP